MKKIFLLSTASAALCLVGCNHATNSATDTAAASSSPNAPVVVTPASNPTDNYAATASNSTASASVTSTATSATTAAADSKPAQNAVAATDAAAVASTTYAAKETYPHAASDASPTALIGGGPTQSGGEPIAASASVIEGRIKEWRLSAAEVQSEIAQGNPMVRTKEAMAGEPTGRSDDEALHTLINNRLLADTEAVRVSTKMDVSNGEVSLHGDAASAEQIGRVMAIVLDTKGVAKVTSDMKIDPTQPGSPRDDAARIPAGDTAPLATPSGPNKPTAEDHANGIDKASGIEPAVTK